VNTAATVSISGGTTAVCSGTAVQLTASGSVSYSWNNGVLLATTYVQPTTTTTYTVNATDANGCTSTATRTVTVNANPTASSSVVTSILCFNGSATVNVTASGGTAPYTGTGNQTASAGRYTFTVTDSNGCTATTSGNLSQPGPISVTGTSSAASCGLNSPSVSVQVVGGTAPYSISSSFDNAGDCTFTVIDANGCTKSEVIPH
jgi:hypothetical protein